MALSVAALQLGSGRQAEWSPEVGLQPQCRRVTLGGPIRNDKTFFFGFQQDNNHSTQNFSLVVPTRRRGPPASLFLPTRAWIFT